MTGSVKIGAVFPQLEIGRDPGELREYAQALEAMGISHMHAYDHVLGADLQRDDPRMATWPPAAYDRHAEFHEPLVLFGFLAAVTTTLELVTGILILPQRQTALAAKQAAEVQILSRGRLRLGVGIGWNHLEYEALGMRFSTRGRRLEEQVTLLRDLWTTPVSAFAGEFDAMPRVGLNPLPDRRIPIWMGARSEVGFQRAARCADGWIAAASGLAPELVGYVETIRRALAEERRSQEEFGIEGRIELRFQAEADIARQVRNWSDLGATHLALNTMAPPDRRDERLPAEGHIELLSRALPVVLAELGGTRGAIRPAVLPE